MVDITFAPIEEENPDREEITFSAEMDGNMINCAITYQALRDHFDADYSDPLFAFMDARSDIEERARKLILEQRLTNNSLLLTTSDFS